MDSCRQLRGNEWKIGRKPTDSKEKTNMQVQQWQCQRIAAALAVLVVVLTSAAPVFAQDKPYTEPDQRLELLKSQFNADVGKVRVLFIGDPTCPPCRHGASVIQDNVVSRFA